MDLGEEHGCGTAMRVSGEIERERERERGGGKRTILSWEEAVVCWVLERMGWNREMGREGICSVFGLLVTAT